MSKERESVLLSDAELDQARDLVTRILEFIASDAVRGEAFAALVGRERRNAGEPARSPTDMLSILDAAVQDEGFLLDLERGIQVDRELIELTQARLSFHIAAELTRQGKARPQVRDMGERARQTLRELSEEQRASGAEGEATMRRTFPGKRAD